MGKVGGVSLQELKLFMETVLIIITSIPSTRHCPIQHPSSSAASLQKNHLKSYAQKVEIHMASNKVTKWAYYVCISTLMPLTCGGVVSSFLSRVSQRVCCFL